MSAETAKKRKSLKKRLVRLVMLLVVLGLGVGAFYLFALPTLSAGATTTYDSYTALRGTITSPTPPQARPLCARFWSPTAKRWRPGNG